MLGYYRHRVVFPGMTVCMYHISPFSFFFPLVFVYCPPLSHSIWLSSRQNPVPEESCARRGHEAAAIHRWLLQGKEPLLYTSFCFPIWLRVCEASGGSEVTAYTVLLHDLNMDMCLLQHMDEFTDLEECVMWCDTLAGERYDLFLLQLFFCERSRVT